MQNLNPHLHTRRRPLAALAARLSTDTGAAVLLIAVAIFALGWANSPFAASYQALWAWELRPWPGVAFTLHAAINEGLMALFFLLVGVEIRREASLGVLADLRVAALPLGAALGGVAVPALIYYGINHAGAAEGWAIPTATDIAFAVGVLALLGPSVPAGVRVILLALAVIDDLVAILIIAIVYSAGLDLAGLLLAGAGVASVVLMQRLGLRGWLAYALAGAVIWAGLHKAGIHPTLAGVILGLLTPPRPRAGQAADQAAGARVQRALHTPVNLGVMPLFALANAGVALGGLTFGDPLVAHVGLGVTLGLWLGKPVGVWLACRLLVALRVCVLPQGVTWSGITLVALLAGIGFTMAIFMAGLSFTSPAWLAAAKLGVLLGSTLAAVGGLLWGRFRVNTPMERLAVSSYPTRGR